RSQLTRNRSSRSHRAHAMPRARFRAALFACAIPNRRRLPMEDLTVTIPRPVLDAMLEDAAERGATRAREKVGLQDGDAGKDVAELRALLEAWRDTKKTVRRTVVKWAIGVVLAAIAAGVALNR